MGKGHPPPPRAGRAGPGPPNKQAFLVLEKDSLWWSSALRYTRSEPVFTFYVIADGAGFGLVCWGVFFPALPLRTRRRGKGEAPRERGRTPRTLRGGGGGGGTGNRPPAPLRRHPSPSSPQAARATALPPPAGEGGSARARRPPPPLCRGAGGGAAHCDVHAAPPRPAPAAPLGPALPRERRGTWRRRRRGGGPGRAGRWARGGSEAAGRPVGRPPPPPLPQPLPPLSPSAF